MLLVAPDTIVALPKEVTLFSTLYYLCPPLWKNLLLQSTHHSLGSSSLMVVAVHTSSLHLLSCLLRGVSMAGLNVTVGGVVLCNYSIHIPLYTVCV